MADWIASFAQAGGRPIEELATEGGAAVQIPAFKQASLSPRPLHAPPLRRPS